MALRSVVELEGGHGAIELLKTEDQMSMTPKKRRTKIKDIDVAELSLVDFAANRKVFSIIKREDQMDELIKLLKSFIGATEEELKEWIEKAKDLPAEAINAIKGALNLLKKYEDVLPDDLMPAIKTLGKYASYGYPAKKEKSADPDIDVEKVGARLSKATLEQLKMIKEVIEKFLGEGPNMKKVKLMLEDLIKTADVAKSQNLAPEIAAQLQELETYKKKEQEDLKKAEAKEMKDLKDLVKKQGDEITELKKSKGKSAQAKDGDDDQDDKDKIEKKADFDKAGKPTRDLWPSVNIGAPVVEE